MLKLISTEIYVQLHKKTTLIAYVGMLTVVMYSIINNVIFNYGRDYNCLYDPVKISLLSSDNKTGFFFTQYYPLFVVLPAAFIFIDDIKCRRMVYVQVRSGVARSYIAKMAAGFLITFLIFTIPLLLELAFNYVTFNPSSIGDPSNSSLVDSIYKDDIIFMPVLWEYSHALYGSVMIILFGLFSSLLGVFAMSISYLPFIKLKVFVFLPVYLTFYITARLDSIIGLTYKTNYFVYIQMFNIHNANNWSVKYALIFTAVLIAATVAVSVYNLRSKRII